MVITVNLQIEGFELSIQLSVLCDGTTEIFANLLKRNNNANIIIIMYLPYFFCQYSYILI